MKNEPTYKGKNLSKMKSQEKSEWILHLLNNPKTITLTHDEAERNGAIKQKIKLHDLLHKYVMESNNLIVIDVLSQITSEFLDEDEKKEAIHRNKAKLTRRERLLQKDDQENMINSCPDYINGGIEQINVPKGKKLTLNEKGQSILVDEPKKSLWSRVRTLLSNLLP